jgi:glycosyltransferase involved in cell wall biosynthesis
MKKVSVAITAYNQADYVAQAVQSVLDQDYPNLEVIVSDNHSTDHIQDVVERFQKDPRFKYFRNETNLGMIGNFQKALCEYSTGEFALHLDGDDYLIDRSYIREAMDLADRHDLAMVFAKSKTLYDKSGLMIEDKVNSDLPELMDGNWFFLNFYRGYSLATLTVVHDRQLAIDVGLFKKNIISTDWEGLLKLMIGHRIGFMNRFAGVWRRHGENETMKIDLQRLLANIDYIESPYRFALERHHFPVEVLDRWRRRMLRRYFVKILSMAMIIKDNDLRKEILEYLRNYDRQVYRSLMLDVRFHAFALAAKSRPLLYFIFKHILKQESFIKDFDYIHPSQRGRQKEKK